MQTDGTKRRFEVVDPATITDPVALSLGLYAYTGQGKTESSLRLAFGIRRVTGGQVLFADCDSGRGLHFRQMFPEMRYIDFRPPHNALDYVALLEQFENERGVLVIDNMTAEHEGEGGLLETKEAAMYDRSGNYREGRSAVAWGVAKTQHKRLVRTFVRVNRKIPVIVTWRAQEKLDWSAKNSDGKSEPKNLGEMPIGSKDLPFEMTATYLLPPGSKGAPCLEPSSIGERMMTKIPRWFDGIVKKGEKFREDHGEAFARWAFATVEKPDVTRLAAAIDGAPDDAAIDVAAKEAAALLRARTITKADLDRLSTKARARRVTLRGEAAAPPPPTVPPARPTPREEPRPDPDNDGR